MTELKPCPFCGGAANSFHCESENEDEDGYIIYCKVCDADAGCGKTLDQAINNWNRRVKDDTERSD